MTEQEGVTKYKLDFRKRKLNITSSHLRALNTCRALMQQEGLMGQDDLRYEGYGFGNISIRNQPYSSAFLISGTQTGQLRSLSASDIACVSKIDAQANYLCAFGEVPPSSEGMSHGVLYQLGEQVQAVVHIHSPDIWQHADDLGLPSTLEHIPYGTPEMASAVYDLSMRLLNAQALDDCCVSDTTPLVIVMKGHEDGVLVAGKALNECSDLILAVLEQAKSINN